MERDVRDKPAYVRSRKFKQRGGYTLTRICRGLLSVDQLVGQVVRKLKKLDRLDNTVLILTSDNGMSFGSQRVLYDKKAPYGTQVPLYVRWPRVLGTQRREVGERIQNIDLAPTLCDIAGCELGPYPTGQARPDGVSFLKLLTGQRETTRPDRGADQLPGAGGTACPPTGASPRPRRRRWPGRAVRGARRGLPLGLHRVRDRGGELYDISNGPCYEWKRSQRGSVHAQEQGREEEVRRRPASPERGACAPQAGGRLQRRRPAG